MNSRFWADLEKYLEINGVFGLFLLNWLFLLWNCFKLLRRTLLRNTLWLNSTLPPSPPFRPYSIRILIVSILYLFPLTKELRIFDRRYFWSLNRFNHRFGFLQPWNRPKRGFEGIQNRLIIHVLFRLSRLDFNSFHSRYYRRRHVLLMNHTHKQKSGGFVVVYKSHIYLVRFVL